MHEFTIADVTTPIPAHHKRLLMSTSIAGGEGETEINRVENGSCYDAENAYAETLVESGAAVVFDPARLLVHLMKAAGVSHATLASHHLTGLPAALKSAKIGSA